MKNYGYSSIARGIIGPGGAPYSRHHIREVLRGRRNASNTLADALVACGAIRSRRAIHVSAF